MHGTFSQPDLFGSAQSDLFAAEPAPSPIYRPDPDRIRGRLRAIMGEARAAQALPWSAHELRLYRTIVPQMVLSLPDDEAARWRADFNAELERLAA